MANTFKVYGDYTFEDFIVHDTIRSVILVYVKNGCKNYENIASSIINLYSLMYTDTYSNKYKNKLNDKNPLNLNDGILSFEYALRKEKLNKNCNYNELSNKIYDILTNKKEYRIEMNDELLYATIYSHIQKNTHRNNILNEIVKQYCKADPNIDYLEESIIKNNIKKHKVKNNNILNEHTIFNIINKKEINPSDSTSGSTSGGRKTRKRKKNKRKRRTQHR